MNRNSRVVERKVVTTTTSHGINGGGRRGAKVLPVVETLAATKTGEGIDILLPVAHNELTTIVTYDPMSGTSLLKETTSSSSHHNRTVYNSRLCDRHRTHKKTVDEDQLFVELAKTPPDVKPPARIRRSSTFERKESELTIDNRKLRSEMEELLRQLEAVKHEKEIVTLRLQEEHQSRDKISKHGEEAMRTKIHHLEEENVHLTSQLDERMREEEGKRRKLELDIHEANDKLSKLKHRNEELEKKYEEELRRLRETEEELTRTRSTRVPGERLSELQGELDKLSAAVQEKERMIEELRRERSEHSTHGEDLVKRLEELNAVLAGLRRAHSECDSQKSVLKSEMELKAVEVERLRQEIERNERDSHHTQINYRSLEEHSRNALDTVCPLQDLVNEQELHISDLHHQVDSLKLTLADYAREIDSLRGGGGSVKFSTHHISGDTICTCGPSPTSADTSCTCDPETLHQFYDIAGAHRRVLAENSRLLLLLQQYQPFPASSKQTDSDGLQEARLKLKSSRSKIKELEESLDRIYSRRGSGGGVNVTLRTPSQTTRVIERTKVVKLPDLKPKVHHCVMKDPSKCMFLKSQNLER